jgi:hypothetical protein
MIDPLYIAESSKEQPRLLSWLLTLSILVVIAVVVYVAFRDNEELLTAQKSSNDEPAAHSSLFDVVIRKPAGPPSVAMGLIDSHGQPITAACNTCHATRAPNANLKLGMTLEKFHQGQKGAHDNLTCVSCHNPQEGYQTLRLADGKALPYSEVMQLCAQCHGPQYRDYSHGGHGGMNGYWDLSRGPRTRNNCIDCHDPHSPKYPIVRPARGPADRSAVNPSEGAGHE